MPMSHTRMAPRPASGGAWNPAQETSLKLWLDPSNTSSMMQEYLNGQTGATTDAQQVGTMYSFAPVGDHLMPVSQATSPTLRTITAGSYTRNALNFNPTIPSAQVKGLTVQNS